MLTQPQIEFYHTFGFLQLKRYFSEHELSIINTEFQKGMAIAESIEKPRGHNEHLKWSTLGPKTPFLRSLQEDTRFLGVAEQIHGKDVVGIFCRSNRFSGSVTEWHPDVEDVRFQGIKFLFYLQPVDGETGALRVIPGSHQNPLHDKLLNIKLRGPNSPYLETSGLKINDMPSHICKSEPGDIIAFDFRLWHAAWGGTTDRRMCALNYYKNPKTQGEIDAAKELAIISKKNESRFKDPHFDPDWLENDERSPRRQRWIDWLYHYNYLD